jgi:hypothetical protein
VRWPGPVVTEGGRLWSGRSGGLDGVGEEGPPLEWPKRWSGGGLRGDGQPG